MYWKHSEETLAKLRSQTSGEGNGFFGKRHSEETKAKMRAARQGRGNHFFGKSHSEETKKLISQNRSGKCLGESNPLFGKYTEEFGAKISATLRVRGTFVGEKNPNYRHGECYRGGAGKRDTTAEYREWRTGVFQRDKYTCQFCGKVGGDLEADHIKPWRFFPELRVDPNNGRTLCVPCHRTTFKNVQKFRKEYYAIQGVENRSIDGK